MNMMNRIKTFFMRNPKWEKESLCIDCQKFDICYSIFEWKRYRNNLADEECYKPFPEEYYQ